MFKNMIREDKIQILQNLIDTYKEEVRKLDDMIDLWNNQCDPC
jgi:hypothetical protein